jgi:enolase
MEEIRGDSASTELPYALGGVGKDTSCPVQIIADEACMLPSDIKKWATEAVFNTIKIRMTKAKTVSGAIALSKAAKAAGWATIVGVEEGLPESTDDFLADFAVGSAASQYHGGGLEAGSNLNKFNRMLRIAKENEGIRYVSRNFR